MLILEATDKKNPMLKLKETIAYQDQLHREEISWILKATKIKETGLKIKKLKIENCEMKKKIC